MLLHRASDSWRSPGSLSLQLALLLGLLILLLTLASAQLPQRLHPGWHAWNTAARAQHRPPASPAGWHAHTYPLPTQYL